MLSRFKSSLRYPVEFGWLLGLAFFLPLFEAPKNLCWLGYVVAWLYNRARDGRWGGGWDRWDVLIAMWVASGYLSAAFAGIHYDEWGAANDILRYGLVLWLVKRSDYDERALLAILATLIVSTLVTLAWGYWRVYIAQTNTTLGLNSVGHVNHSAIYMAIVFGVAFSLALAYWKNAGPAARVLAAVATAALIGSVFVTGSRAAVGAATLFVFAWLGLRCLRQRSVGRRGFLLAILGIGLLFAANPSELRKNVEKAQTGAFAGQRDEVWKNALIEWRRFPLFGVGMGNFGRVRFDQLQAWNQTQDWSVRPSERALASHAHSLYLNTLAERGLVGFAVLITVLAAWAAALAAAVPRGEDPPLAWTLFGAALSGLLVTVAVGFFNTTLHHEHGILGVLLLGLLLSQRRTADAAAAVTVISAVEPAVESATRPAAAP